MKPTPEEWRRLAGQLATIYNENHAAAAWQLRQHRHFMEVPNEPFDLVSVHRVIHMHREGDPTIGPRSGQSLTGHRPSLAEAGYREISEKQPEFETLWRRYEDLCETVGTRPSGGPKKPPRARTFFVISAPAERQNPNGADAYTPDDLPAQQDGSASQVTRNQFERRKDNRRACIAHYLTEDGRILCEVCGTDFEDRFGDIGQGYIHIHHKHPLAEQQPPDEFDPKEHLVPVCPNCHAMLHKKPGKSAFTIEELRERLRANGFSTHE